MKGAHVAAVVLVVAAAALLIWKTGMGDEPNEVRRATTIRDLVPAPVSVVAGDESFIITVATPVTVDTGAEAVGAYLVDLLAQVTSHDLTAAARPTGGADPADGIVLSLRPDAQRADELGDEGYTIDTDARALTVRANTAAGLFRGVQTLRQLLPVTGDAGWSVPGGQIVDHPRYPYRGVMLDVARHFFPVADIKRLIDLIALYKINYLHLHLTDDQGWRIAVDSWPRLTEFGAGSEVGDGPGGFYSKADYTEIVEYAGRHFITVVPEVDLPGHTNAALASYAELTCDGVAPARYTGIAVGFSSLCADNDLTYKFLGDVFGELAALTPGPYLHIGGDEATTLSPDDYAAVVDRAQEIVAGHGKTVVGWHEVAGAKLLPSTVVQYWGVVHEAPEVREACAEGTKVIMSPANHTYLDMKYEPSSPLGLSWAGLVNIETAYDWDPATHITGVDPACVLGVESPLWTETVRTMDDIEYLAFPRLAAIAEVGWSPTREWDDFRDRLGAQGPRWRALGVNFYASPEIGWVVNP